MTEFNHQLDRLLPYGLLATMRWLLSKGMSRHTVDNAIKSRKLTPLATGVYSRTGIPISWQSVVCSIQTMDENPTVVGGLSALSLLGYSHYLSTSKTNVYHLYAENKLPTWLAKLQQGFNFKWHSTKKIWPATVLTDERYIRDLEWREGLPSVKLSCPEKAYLELLADVPTRVSFDHANEIMQGMTSLSPNKLTELLKACRSVKVKRLFFFLAEKQDYAWFKKLDVNDFDLGGGKRVIAHKGKFDNKYQITVPEHLYGQ